MNVVATLDIVIDDVPRWRLHVDPQCLRVIESAELPNGPCATIEHVDGCGCGSLAVRLVQPR